MNGQEYYLKAEKKLKSWAIFSSKESNIEEAAELFAKSANYFKISKDWVKAADAFKRAANLKTFDTINYLLNAASCFKHIRNLNETFECYKQAHNEALNLGKYKDAAKYLKEIAELYENDGDILKAINFYTQAIELYESEHENNYFCLLKIAHYMSTKEINKYNEAIKIFEKLVDTSINNNLQKFKINEYLLKACLCSLTLGDLIGTKHNLELYYDRNASFETSPEGIFIQSIINCIDSYDIENFTNIIINYDQIYPLDKWKTEILLVIKETIQKV